MRSFASKMSFPSAYAVLMLVIVLSVFVLTFVVMIFGVSRLDWWFPEMTTLFFAATLVIGIIDRPGEKIFTETFIAGAQNLLGVGLIIGIARGATFIWTREKSAARFC